jgi:hypothetical protein
MGRDRLVVCLVGLPGRVGIASGHDRLTVSGCHLLPSVPRARDSDATCLTRTARNCCSPDECRTVGGSTGATGSGTCLARTERCSVRVRDRRPPIVPLPAQWQCRRDQRAAAGRDRRVATVRVTAVGSAREMVTASASLRRPARIRAGLEVWLDPHERAQRKPRQRAVATTPKWASSAWAHRRAAQSHIT